MDPQALITEGRTTLVHELNIAGLEQAEQDNILDELGEQLMRRVLVKFFQLLPEDEQDRFQRLLNEENGDAAQLLVEKYVPNSSEIVQQELRAGVEEYKSRSTKR